MGTFSLINGLFNSYSATGKDWEKEKVFYSSPSICWLIQCISFSSFLGFFLHCCNLSSNIAQLFQTKDLLSQNCTYVFSYDFSVKHKRTTLQYLFCGSKFKFVSC